MNKSVQIQKLLEKNQVEEALKLLEENKKEMDYDEYHAYYALSLEMKQQYQEALNEYYKIQYIGERIRPKFYYFHLAVCLNALGKTKQALANLIKIEDEITNKDMSLHWQFYLTYNALGEEKKAKEHIEVICKKNKDPFYQIRYANLLNNLGFFEKAYRIEKKLYQKYKEDSFLLRELSSSSYNMKKYKESKEYLNRLIEQKQALDWDYLYLANIHIFYEQYEEAIQTLNQIKQQSVSSSLQYAFCYRKLGKEKKAIQYYQQAIKNDPKDILGIASYIAYYREIGKYEEALEALKQYRKQVPEYQGRIYYEIAKVESDREDYKKAITYLKKAEKIEEHPLIFCDLAWNYKQLEKYKEEKISLEKALQYLPKDDWVLSELGFCFLQLGEYQRALETYFQVNINHNEVDKDRFFYEVGICYEMTENFLEATASFLKINKKESYTYGHLVKCFLELDFLEQAKFWIQKINLKKEKDPWFLEIHLNYLEETKSYQELSILLEKKKKILPQVLYLQKKVFLLVEQSKNKKDPNLVQALKYQKKIQKIEGETSRNLLMEASILNRMNAYQEAKSCLEKIKPQKRQKVLFKREWIQNLILSKDPKKLEEAYLQSKALYQETKEEKDLFLIGLSSYQNKKYLRALFYFRKLKKKNLFLEEIEVLYAICLDRIGFSFQQKRKRKQWEKMPFKNDYIEEFLEERKDKK